MIHEAHACEMLLRVNILTCFPGETRDDLQQTCAFVREHAFAIDDLAPSSFYLTSDSPIGRRPERYGIVLRGPRELRGDHRFRKSPDSLQYDEIGGYSWEERQPMLDESESLVRSAWRDGREGVGFTGSLGPTTMLALRRRCATKREIVELLRGEPRATRTVACDVVPREPLVAKLIAPSHPSPALERVFELAADRLRFAAAARLSHGSTAHVVLFPDGGSYFFRGSVARGAGGRPRSIAIEETLAAPDGGVADDLRGRALRPGIRLDGARIAAALGAFALLSFRMERAAATDDEEAT
jgi:hypothetical protein